jgi:hypothetical protein
METFTLDLPRWMRRIREHNPLLRTSDRIEALTLVVAVVVAVLAAPFAGAVATATSQHGAAGQAMVATLAWGVFATLAWAAHLAVRAWFRWRRSQHWQQGFDRLVEKAAP